MSERVTGSQPAPRQDSVAAYISRNPGATLNDVFHDLRATERGVTYESVRSAVRKLMNKRCVRAEGHSALYRRQLFMTTEKTVG